MSFGTTTTFEVNSSGSDTNNGGGFDTGATFATDGSISSGTTASPVFSSASYNFVSGDVGAYLFIKSGANGGWYAIASVASNAATLTASIGSVVTYNGATPLNTVAGVGSSSPSSITWGVDYSRSTSPRISYTDAVIGATNTTYTSVGNPVGPNIIGNIVVWTAGTGWTFQRVEVTSVSGTTATCDKALGTANSIAGVGGLGGCLASPGQFGALASAAMNCFIKAGTYNMSGTSNVSGGRLTYTSQGFVSGYTSTRISCNYDTRPVLQSNANTFTLITTTGSNHIIACLDLQNGNANTSITGFDGSGDNVGTLFRVNAQGVATGIKINQSWQVYLCSTINNTGSAGGFTCSSSETILYGCTSVNCENPFVGSSGQSHCVRCIAAGSAGTGYGFTSFRTVQDCVAYNPQSTLAGFKSCTFHLNCIAVGASGSGGYGFDTGTGGQQAIISCAGFNNSTNYNPTNVLFGRVQNFIALTANPFVSAGTTTSADFTLNSTAGGGALLRSLGYPTTWPGLASTSYSDIGAIRHADPMAGATGYAF